MLPRIKEEGVLYRNPSPHVRSVQAYFPSVVTMDNGEMLATLVLAEAFEAPNMRSWTARSRDEGRTWQLEKAIYPGTQNRLTSDGCRLTAFPGGELAAFMVRHDRTDHPDEGLTNPETLGFVPTELLLLRSCDYGHTWSEPAAIDPPLCGPSFELCSPITPLRDGRWVLPTSTWRGWDGHSPNGNRMVALVSSDRGESWPVYWNVLHNADRSTFFWESKIVELPDGRLLAVAWTYDELANADLPNHYSLSADHGKTWLAPQSMGLCGQTLTPYLMASGHILSVYRRKDTPGLWAAVSHLDGDNWVNDHHVPLWGALTEDVTDADANMAQKFQTLRFGAPCLCELPGGDLFVAFWCVEECVAGIRWIRLTLGL